MKKHYFVALCCASLLFGLVSCARDSSSNTDNQEATQTSSITALPADIRQSLWESCDYIDIIFYNSPISMSQEDQPAIRGSLSMISGQPAVPGENCKALGRISFMQQGVIMTEADFYSSEQCHYFQFLQDGKPTYAETLTPAGINFFAQIQQQYRNAVQ